MLIVCLCFCASVILSSISCLHSWNPVKRKDVTTNRPLFVEASFVVSLYCQAFVYQLLLIIGVPICQTSCPLRTIHFSSAAIFLLTWRICIHQNPFPWRLQPFVTSSRNNIDILIHPEGHAAWKPNFLSFCDVTFTHDWVLFIYGE